MIAAASAVALAGPLACRPSDNPPPVVKPTQTVGMDADVASIIARHVRAAEASPHDGRAHGTLGLVYEANGMWSQAQACFETAARLAPDNPAWAHHRALARWSNGDLAGARDILADIVLTHPDYGPAWHRLGYAQLYGGDLSAAETAFARCLKLSPGRPYGYVGLAEVRLRQRNYAGAIALLEEAVPLAPSYKTTHYLLGQAYRGMGRQEDARRELAQGLDATVRFWEDPIVRSMRKYKRGPAARVQKATNLLGSGQVAKAAAILEGELVRLPRDPRVLNNLAFAYNNLGRFEEARELLLRAVEVDDTDVTAQLTLTATLLAMGRAGQALPHAKRAAQLAPSNGQAHFAAARVHLALGESADARTALEAAVRLDVGDPQVYLELGSVCIQLQDYEAARRNLKTAARLLPDRIEPYLELCEACIGLRDLDAAGETLAEARRLEPAHPRVRALAARLREMQGGPAR